jgi:hypothetical protein
LWGDNWGENLSRIHPDATFMGKFLGFLTIESTGLKMRYLITVFCMLGWFATPVLAESNDFTKYQYDPKKQLKYKSYEDSRGVLSNFNSETLLGIPKTGQGFVFEGNKIPLPGENSYGRTPTETQAGIKLSF